MVGYWLRPRCCLALLVRAPMVLLIRHDVACQALRPQMMTVSAFNLIWARDRPCCSWLVLLGDPACAWGAPVGAGCVLGSWAREGLGASAGGSCCGCLTMLLQLLVQLWGNRLEVLSHADELVAGMCQRGAGLRLRNGCDSCIELDQGTPLWLKGGGGALRKLQARRRRGCRVVRGREGPDLRDQRLC